MFHFDFDYGLNYQFKIISGNIGRGLCRNSKKLKTKNVTTIQTEAETETLRSRKYKYAYHRIFSGFARQRIFQRRR
jgi:hypothetical protein